MYIRAITADHHLARLQGKERLTYLAIGGNFSDAALAHLEGLSDLNSLDIYCPDVQGSGFRHLVKLKNLKYLRGQ